MQAGLCQLDVFIALVNEQLCKSEAVQIGSETTV